MVFSYHLFKQPYRLVYNALARFGLAERIYFYCREIQDWEAFEPVQNYLRPVRIVTNKPAVRQYFRSRNIQTSRLPVFPKAVIMARHSCYKFPSARIIKIGMRHGPYHFKKMTRAENYNQFDLYLMTSRDDVAEGSKIGITCSRAVGYPKLDPWLANPGLEIELEKYRSEAKLDSQKPTLLFSATWTGSGMSALEFWYDKLHKLKESFNVLVTLHPWVGINYRQAIAKQGVYLINGNHLPYVKLSDIVIGDTSSLLAEACALDKPMITWQTGTARRALDKIDRLLRSISIRIARWDELRPAINLLLSDPSMFKASRATANAMMFDQLDGKAGERAAREIINLLPELKP